MSQIIVELKLVTDNRTLTHISALSVFSPLDKIMCFKLELSMSIGNSYSSCATNMPCNTVTSLVFSSSFVCTKRFRKYKCLKD